MVRSDGVTESVGKRMNLTGGTSVPWAPEASPRRESRNAGGADEGEPARRTRHKVVRPAGPRLRIWPRTEAQRGPKCVGRVRTIGPHCGILKRALEPRDRTQTGVDAMRPVPS